MFNASKTKAMLVCNKRRMETTGIPAHFNAGNGKIAFVKNFCYLGCILDRELTMVPA